MPNSKSAFADNATTLTRLLSSEPEFDDFVFRSLKPISISLAFIFTVFVLLGLIDHSAGDVRQLIVATDVAAVAIFVGIYFLLAADRVPRKLTYPVGFFIASIPLANALIAFALTKDPFFLTYLPMIAIACGAYMLSLPWLAAMFLLILVSSFVAASDAMPIVTVLRYSPALIGAYLVAFLMFLTRRWHIIDTHRALLAQQAEAEERKRAESHLAHAQRLESIGKLVSGIAHDFNNLLTVIVGYTDSMLSATDKDSPFRPDLQEIQGASQRAATLAQNLLAFSRQQLMQLRIVELDKLIADARSLISRAMPANINLRLDLDAAGAHVAVDPLQLEQVLINLALNARDAMADLNGELTIATRVISAGDDDPDGRNQHRVEMRVTDTGAGMTEAVQQRVFEPFFTTKERGAGTGLGLAMAHGIVTQSAGTIDIESAPGKGTTVVIRLPKASSPGAEVAAASPLQDAHTDLEDAAILVVDDERAVLDVVARTLKQYQCRVRVAGSGEEALEIAAHEPFDLLLTDVSMPGMSGLELVDALQLRGFSAPVLLMSGYPAGEAARTGEIELPLLHKPFGAQELLRTVARTLDGIRKNSPVPQDEAGSPASARPESTSTANSHLRVLLIDDHEELLNIVAEMIRKLGHSCISCSDSAKAMDMLHRQHPHFDVVITDYSMPGMSGGEILETCRRDYPHLTTLLFTGYSEFDAKALARGKGADGFLIKPPTRETLAEALEKVMVASHV